MAAIEDADLHVLVGGDVGHELHADLLQRRAAGGKIVLQHPLLEFLAIDRPGIVDAQCLAAMVDLALAGRRGDAVHHAVRKGDIRRNPFGQRAIDQPRHADDGGRADLAVMGNVVAGHHREGGNAARMPRPQPRADQAEHRRRRLGVLRVGDDRRMGRIELAVRINEIAALGHRQGDDPDRRIGELFDDRRRVAHRQHVDHRAGHPGAGAGIVLLDDGGQVILPRQPVAHGLVGGHDAGAEDREIVPLPHLEQGVEIDRLMGPMEIADAEMHDAGTQARAVVARHRGLAGDVGKIGGAKPDAHGRSPRADRRGCQTLGVHWNGRTLFGQERLQGGGGPAGPPSS